jgi:hypothetical protein
MTAPLPPIGTRVTVAVNRDTRRWAIDGRVGHVTAHETTCEPWKVEVTFDNSNGAFLLLPPEWVTWDEQP